jgi:hypothetical protein
VLDSDHSRELELESVRLASGCMQIGHSNLGAALKAEIRRLAGGTSTDQEAARKHELACLRMAADCMQLVGDIRTPDLQRHFLELARLLTAAAETALTTSI